MKSKMIFTIRQNLKMFLQNCILPLIYRFWCLVYRKKGKDLIIFADAHRGWLPVSMELTHKALEEKGYSLTDEFYHFGQMGTLRTALVSMRFMRLYAQAKYVFICDNFLPVTACKKQEDTKVIQLWHACGLLKKMGYDTEEDIPAGYKGAVYRNYDVVTVSAPCCVEPMAKAMRLPEDVLQPVGVSRTDVYFDQKWIDDCRAVFYEQYPQAKGKKIVLWAPTFRGNASDPQQVGMEGISRLQQQLGEDYFLIIKAHPHVDAKYQLSNCDIVTERLLPVTDLLITDYSTVVHEFLFFRKPYVLYAPDLEEYQQKRGFYIEYESLSPYLVTRDEELHDTVRRALADQDLSWVDANRAFHASACDGNSTQRILDLIGL